MSTDDSMIERVAMAIGKAAYDRDWDGFPEVDNCPSSPEESPDRVWLRELARAAIEAMREPTEAMGLAGDEHLPDMDVGGCCEPVWRAMIDEALKNHKED